MESVLKPCSVDHCSEKQQKKSGLTVKPTCSAPTMLIGLHLNRWLMNLGMKELKEKDAERTLELGCFSISKCVINEFLRLYFVNLMQN